MSLPERVDFSRSYRIREALQEDAATLADFQIAMAKETEGIDLDPETVHKGVQIPFLHPKLATYYVAEYVGECERSPSTSTNVSVPKVVAGLMVTNEYNVFEASTMWWIQSVYTLPKHRRRGLFASLYSYVKEKAQHDPSILGLRLYVEHDNEAAQRSYVKLGMRVDPFQMAKFMKGAI